MKARGKQVDRRREDSSLIGPHIGRSISFNWDLLVLTWVFFKPKSKFETKNFEIFNIGLYTEVRILK